MAVKLQFCWVWVERWQRHWQGWQRLGRASCEWGGHEACQASKYGLFGVAKVAVVAVGAMRAEDPPEEEWTSWQGAGGLGT